MSSQHFPKLPPPSLSLSSLSLGHLSSSVSVWLCRSQASALNAASFLQPSLAHSPTWHGPTWNSVFFLREAGGEGAADTLCILNFWQGARSCVSENFVQVLHFHFNFFVPHTHPHTNTHSLFGTNFKPQVRLVCPPCPTCHAPFLSTWANF